MLESTEYTRPLQANPYKPLLRPNRTNHHKTMKIAKISLI